MNTPVGTNKSHMEKTVTVPLDEYLKLQEKAMALDSQAKQYYFAYSGYPYISVSCFLKEDEAITKLHAINQDLQNKLFQKQKLIDEYFASKGKKTFFQKLFGK